MLTSAPIIFDPFPSCPGSFRLLHRAVSCLLIHSESSRHSFQLEHGFIIFPVKRLEAFFFSGDSQGGRAFHMHPDELPLDAVHHEGIEDKGTVIIHEQADAGGAFQPYAFHRNAWRIRLSTGSGRA